MNQKLKGYLAQAPTLKTWHLSPLLQTITQSAVMKQLILLTAFRVTIASNQVNAVNSTNIDNLSDAIICAIFASQSNSSQLVNKDLEQIYPDDLEEMDLKWQMARLTMRSRRFLKNTGRKLNLNGNETIAFDKTKVNVTISIRGATLQENVEHQEHKTTGIGRAQERVELRKKLETVQREKDGIQLTVKKLKNASKSLNKLIDSQIMDNYKKGLGYNAISPLHTGLVMPPKLDLSYIGLEEFTSEHAIETINAKTSEEVPKVVKKDNGALIIKDWKLDDEDERMPQPKIEKKTIKPSVSKEASPISQFMKKLIEDMLPLEVTLKEEKSLVKDETSGILKSFITRIENLVDHKVKVIRCDNGIEFKNRDMNQFYEMKGIMRQYSVARTPQQNRVAKRRNRILIEAARTMLSDSKLPTTFRAEPFSIACYVQNRVLVVKPHNKTPYVLFHELKSSQDNGFKPSNKVGKKVNEVPRQENECKNQVETDSVNNTKIVNVISLTVNAASNEVNAIGNKARLFAQRQNQEEGIDYNEVFALIARIKAIRLFLAYASFKDFVVYQMNVKSAFLYGKIKEEVYVCQPPGFKDPDFLTKWKKHYMNFIKLQRHVYADDIICGSTKKDLCSALDKMVHEKFQMSSMGELIFFLGLQVKQKQDGISISQDKYVAKILKKFRFSKVKTASTYMETQKPLLKDKDGEECKKQTVVANSTTKAEYVAASSCCSQMVNTRTDADLAAAVRNALQTLLPKIRTEICEEFRTGSRPSGSGGNPPPFFPQVEQELLKRKYHSIRQMDT
nr:hypothetical protein [Tanacetum cinerariifolium]